MARVGGGAQGGAVVVEGAGEAVEPGGDVGDGLLALGRHQVEDLAQSCSPLTITLISLVVSPAS